MDDGTVRQVLPAVVVACTVLAAGCVSLPGGASEDCGPGPDRIGTIGQSQNVTVEGTIQSINETSLVVDDGSGTALLVTDRQYNTSVARTGDCVVASGQTVDSESTNATPSYDVIVLAGNVSVKT